MTYAKNARLRLKLTQEAFAEAVGVSRPTVSGWEREDSEGPSDLNRVRIDQLLSEAAAQEATIADNSIQESEPAAEWRGEMHGRSLELQALMTYVLQRQQQLTSALAKGGKARVDKRQAKLFESMKEDSARLLAEFDEPKRDAGGQ